MVRVYRKEHCGSYTRLTVKFYDRGKFRVLGLFKTRTGPVAKKCNFQPSGWESNTRPRESSAMLCQLSYRGRCGEHGLEFSLYMVLMPKSRKVYLEGYCGICTRLTVKFYDRGEFGM